MEKDQDLRERDNEEAGDFPPRDREIHTQGYDLSVNTLKAYQLRLAQPNPDGNRRERELEWRERQESDVEMLL